MNGLAFGDFLTQAGIENRVFSAVALHGVVDVYNRDRALELMQAGGVAILTGGTGNPFFTTDTAACLRGIELGVDKILKATNVDGVYDDDPRTNPNATKFETVSFDEVLAKSLGVMDLTAFVLCKEHALPIVVFDMRASGHLVEIVKGGTVGTEVHV